MILQIDTTAVAENATEAAAKTLSVFELTVAGGVIMIPLLILSVITVYIFVERYMVLKKASEDDPAFMANIRDYISDANIEAAKSLCDNTNSSTARMLSKGISRIGKPLKDISQAIENVGKQEIFKLEKNLSALATIAGAAPMIGFLGTVTGMIKTFFNMANAGGNIDIPLLSGGIYQAMVTTVGGLTVGLIALIAYNILVAKVESVVHELEGDTIEFMDLLNEPAS
jgi:biopolymer transport protein ExbB